MDRLIDWFDATPIRRTMGVFTPGGASFIIGWSVLEPLGVQPGLQTTVGLLLLSIGVVLVVQLLLFRRRLRRYELIARRMQRLPDGPVSTPRHTVGVIAPLSMWPTDFYRDLVAGIRTAADRESPDRQRRIIVFDVPKESYDSVSDIAAFAALETTVDGLISANIRLPDDLVARLQAAAIPVLNVFHEEEGPPFIGNIIPDHSGFQDLLEDLLIAQAAKPALLVTKPLENPYKKIEVDPYRNQKRAAFANVAKRAGLRMLAPFNDIGECALLRNEAPNFAAVVEVDQYNFAIGHDLFDSCLSSLPPNAAVVCLADVVAAGIILAAKRSGRPCEQRHLRVTGFDNTALSNELDLTTVDYCLELVGRLAYDKIQIAIEHGVSLKTTTERVETKYIERQSGRW